MAEFVEWGFYDSEDDTVDSVRNLPHKEQSETIAFVTFRLLDSMPNTVVKLWHDEIENWLNENGLGGMSVDDVLKSGSVSDRQKDELRKFKNRKWHGRLDDCHGQCILRRSDCRAVVTDSILHFNGDRYDVESFVVMPNHVHVLIQMRQGFVLRKQFREIQRYSARSINKLLEKSGRLWQGEPFDHLVRNANHLEYLHQYIFDNPKRAKLSDTDYSYWSCR